MVPTILFALQAPTLLNNFAQIPEVWDVRYVKTGPVDFAEESLLEVPEWDGALLSLFVGCDASHEAWAARHLLDVPCFTMIHTSDPNDMGGRQFGKHLIGMQRHGLNLAAWHLKPKSTHYLSIAYEAKPSWTWAPDEPWSMMSRPQHRRIGTQARMKFLKEKLPHLKLYGQDKPDGFLTGATRTEVLAHSSCYVSMVGPEAGVGLMEHEAMAAGVPVVARAWGDLKSNMPDYPALADNDDDLLALAIRCSWDRSFAEYVAEAGLRYTKLYRTRESLVQSATELLAFAEKRRREMMGF
jgi:hypothetical protein